MPINNLIRFLTLNPCMLGNQLFKINFDYRTMGVKYRCSKNSWNVYKIQMLEVHIFNVWIFIMQSLNIKVELQITQTLRISDGKNV